MVKTFTAGEREGLHRWYNIRSLRSLVEEVIIRTLMALAESYLFYALALRQRKAKAINHQFKVRGERPPLQQIKRLIFCRRAGKN